MEIPKIVKEHIEKNYEIIKKSRPKLAELYKNCYPNTIETALVPQKDGSYFVLTGDIPAMWLRDSTAEVSHYIPLCHDEEVKNIIKGVIKRQFMYIAIEPYSNSFNEEANNNHYEEDIPANDPWVWERKYEVDSLCYPFRLLYLYWKETGDNSLLDQEFIKTVKTVISLWKTEQEHMEKSPYIFIRPTDNPPCLHNNGKGNPVSYTGMTWSGFRPSDDQCTYGYLIPSNIFAVVVLGYIAEMLEAIGYDKTLVDDVNLLKAQIEEGVNKFGIIDHEKYGKVYACETDGMGNHLLFDDANVPSLLSIPYLGYKNDEVYKNTRKLILSPENPYYYEGKFAKGIGSPHTPENYIWHIALSMQGLTAESNEEILEILDMLENTDAGTGFMHEGFLADDPGIFTRPWFSWSNSLFAEFVESALEKGIL